MAARSGNEQGQDGCAAGLAAPDRGRKASKVAGLAAVACAALPMAYWWGFTVDDALVIARVAKNLAVGAGYRFNIDGPPVDAVTPLGWAYLLAPFARSGCLQALGAARYLGAAAWLLAAYWLGLQVDAAGGSRARFVALAVLAGCGPLAAWAGAGMETGVVTALCTFALAQSRVAPLAAGLAAGWRPELLPWAVVLCAGGQLQRSRSVGRMALFGAVAALPAVAAAATRAVVFGSAAPLGALAKPSDLQHGLWYLGAAMIWTGVPALTLAPWALRRVPGRYGLIAVATVAHCLSMVLAGGDWMSLFRLMVPVLPGALVVGAAVAGQAQPWATAVRAVCALVPCAVLLVKVAPNARAVWPNRLDLIRRARVHLAAARRVAAVDIGWVGAATSAQIVDLAGITDPTVAALPGGHTSKRLPPDFLRRRQVDHVLLLLPSSDELQDPWYNSRFSYAVERRIVEQSQQLDFEPQTILRVGDSARAYLLLRRREGSLSPQDDWR